MSDVELMREEDEKKLLLVWDRLEKMDPGQRYETLQWIVKNVSGVRIEITLSLSPCGRVHENLLVHLEKFSSRVLAKETRFERDYKDQVTAIIRKVGL